MKTITVVAAVIRNSSGEIFVTQRGYGEFKDWWELPGGKFIIETENNSKSNIYIQDVFINGKPEDSLKIPFSTITNGGTLKLKMGKK